MTRPEGAVWSSCGIATLPQSTGDCVVPEGGGGGKGHLMPAVSEAKLGEVQSGPKSQQPSPEPEFISTRVRPPARFQDLCSQLANSILFYVLLFYVCFVSSHVEVLREGNC